MSCCLQCRKVFNPAPGFPLRGTHSTMFLFKGLLHSPLKHTSNSTSTGWRLLSWNCPNESYGQNVLYYNIVFKIPLLLTLILADSKQCSQRIEFIYSVVGNFCSLPVQSASVSGFLVTISYGDSIGGEVGVMVETFPWQERKAIGEHCHCVTIGLFEVVMQTCLLQSPTAISNKRWQGLL